MNNSTTGPMDFVSPSSSASLTNLSQTENQSHMVTATNATSTISSIVTTSSLPHFPSQTQHNLTSFTQSASAKAASPPTASHVGLDPLRLSTIHDSVPGSSSNSVSRSWPTNNTPHSPSPDIRRQSYPALLPPYSNLNSSTDQLSEHGRDVDNSSTSGRPSHINQHRLTRFYPNPPKLRNIHHDKSDSDQHPKQPQTNFRPHKSPMLNNWQPPQNATSAAAKVIQAPSHMNPQKYHLSLPQRPPKKTTTWPIQTWIFTKARYTSISTSLECHYLN